MKHYQLAAWPELPAPFQRMAYRRMLHQMSQRPATLNQLVRHSGLERSSVQSFIDVLAARQWVVEREPVPVSLMGRVKLLVAWLERLDRRPWGRHGTPLARSLHRSPHGRTPDAAHRRRCT